MDVLVEKLGVEDRRQMYVDEKGFVWCKESMNWLCETNFRNGRMQGFRDAYMMVATMYALDPEIKSEAVVKELKRASQEGFDKSRKIATKW